ncbi:MAG: glycosyltransferase [Candidatus Latescibacterota bacterium]|nr:MAG: glycosyltransferase [Candidatus Latescibacterota bacterium]
MKVVWFSEIKWNYLRTRKQQIIARKPADVQLLFLEPFVKSGRNTYRLRTEGGIFSATVPFLKSAPYFPWRTVLDRGSARWVIDLAVRTRVQRILKQLRFEPSSTGFIISNIYAANIVSSLPRRFLLYDCNDDHSSFPGMRSWTKAYFYKTSREADAIFASSQALLDKITDVRGSSGGCEYLGNGVDYEHFQKNGDPRTVEPGGKPRLGYIGALAPWFDFDALAELARERPEWEIVLVGPILLGVDKKVTELTSLPNVFRLPAVSYDRLPAILRQFSVGLIPFRYNELTRGVNPNKLYEYLAAGLPVVTTRFSSEVERYTDLVKAVDPGASFIRACEEFVDAVSDENESAGLAERARRIAREHDWDVIAATFWKKVEELMNQG